MRKPERDPTIFTANEDRQIALTMQIMLNKSNERPGTQDQTNEECDKMMDQILEFGKSYEPSNKLAAMKDHYQNHRRQKIDEAVTVNEADLANKTVTTIIDGRVSEALATDEATTNKVKLANECCNAYVTQPTVNSVTVNEANKANETETVEENLLVINGNNGNGQSMSERIVVNPSESNNGLRYIHTTSIVGNRAHVIGQDENKNLVQTQGDRQLTTEFNKEHSNGVTKTSSATKETNCMHKDLITLDRDLGELDGTTKLPDCPVLGMSRIELFNKLKRTGFSTLLIPKNMLRREQLYAIKDEEETLAYLSTESYGRKFFSMVDTGATKNSIGPRLIQIARLIKVPITGESKLIYMADGSPLKIIGTMELTMTIHGITSNVKFNVCPDLAFDCVLGFGGLGRFKVQISTETKQWKRNEDTEWRDFDAFTPAELQQSLCTCGVMRVDIDQRKQLEDIVEDWKKTQPDGVGLTNLAEHHINTGDHQPIKAKWHSLNKKKTAIAREMIQEMLQQNIIEESSSEWNAPIVLVMKPGKNRLCVDYRELNSVTKKDAYPLPRMNYILDRLHEAKYISTIDLSRAYHQIPMAADSKEKTAFTVPHVGFYHYNRMPFGLCNAGSAFQRVVDKIFGPEFLNYVYAYQDDITVVTKTFGKHLYWIGRVREKLEKAGLHVEFRKCQFGKESVKYLGFIVDGKGLRIDNDRIDPIIKYPAPRTIKQLKRFIGMASWYRKFVPNFAMIVEPLTQLQRKAIKWHWGNEEQEAFIYIKECLANDPSLASPDFEMPFELQTDASNTGLGAVLSQVQEEDEAVIAYASCTMTDAERNYTTTEQECLAVIFGIRKFREYLENFMFTIITNHSSLQWLVKMKNPSGRLI